MTIAVHRDGVRNFDCDLPLLVVPFVVRALERLVKRFGVPRDSDAAVGGLTGVLLLQSGVSVDF